MRSRTRLFVAVGLEDQVRKRTASKIAKIQNAVNGYRWVAPESLHVTLAFLGEVEATRIPALSKSLDDAVSDFPAFDVRFKGFGAFPHSRNAKTLWIGVTDGGEQMCDLQELVVCVLEDFDFRRENRPFVPHLTVGRLKRDRRSSEIAEILQRESSWDAGVNHVDGVEVMSSELKPSGPLYTVVARCPLMENSATDSLE